MNLIKVAGISGALAVILGAFGAHTLKQHLSPEQLQTFETGVRYHFYHSIALLGCGIFQVMGFQKQVKVSAYLFLAGNLFFSGSVYLLATRNLLHIENWSFLGPVTPIGGLFFIAGWLSLAFAKFQNKSQV